MRKSIDLARVVDAYCDVARWGRKRPSLRAIGTELVFPASGLYRYVSDRAELDRLAELRMWERLAAEMASVPVDMRIEWALNHAPGWMWILSELGSQHPLPGSMVALTPAMTSGNSSGIDWLLGYMGSTWYRGSSAPDWAALTTERMQRVDELVAAIIERSRVRRSLAVLFEPGEMGSRLLALDVDADVAAALHELVVERRVPSMRQLASRKGVAVSSLYLGTDRPALINGVAGAVLQVVADGIAARRDLVDNLPAQAEVYLTLEYTMATQEPALMELFDEIRIEDCLNGWVTVLAERIDRCRNDSHRGVPSFDIAALVHGIIRRTWRSSSDRLPGGHDFVAWIGALVEECLTPAV